MKIKFPYSEISSINIPEDISTTILEPKYIDSAEDEIEIIRRSLNNPISSQNLKTLATNKEKILIVVDDYSRNTPLKLILPEVLKDLYSSGVPKTNIKFLIASGTHRKMTDSEKLLKFGEQILADHVIMDHFYNNLDEIVQLQTTAGGTQIWVNRNVLDADLVIGVGHIVPHRVAGFSGGGKIIQPGVCGSITTGQTHWLSAQYPGSEIIGKAINPVRQEIDSVAMTTGLRFIINVVLDAKGKVVSCHSGDPILAFRDGAKISKDIYGVRLNNLADIVIVDSYPNDIDFWLAAKGVYSGDLALKQGGVIIMVTPCPEGVSSEHTAIEEIGYRPFKEIDEAVSLGKINDLTVAAHLVHVGRVIREKGVGYLVSPGISQKTTEQLGFIWAPTPQYAFDQAVIRIGKNPHVAVLKNGGEIMPIIEEHNDTF